MTFTKSTDTQPVAENSDALPLSELVSLRPRFLRSVNLERDFYAESPLDGYVPTPSARTALERIAVGVHQPASRAWSITGPFGTGKSALALLTSKTLTLPPLGDPSLRAHVAVPLFDSEQEGFWPVLVTGGREPLARAYSRLAPIAVLAPFICASHLFRNSRKRRARWAGYGPAL